MSFYDDLTPSGEDWIASGNNHGRADWAEEAVITFRDVCKGDMDETALYDLVGNMGHLCDRLSVEFEDFDMTFDEMVERARYHYEAERGEGDDIEQSMRHD